MSLAFLAKKPWHTATVKNVEKVWLAEQKRDEEEKRVAELKKQIDEEREIDDLRKLQKDQGLVTDPKQKVEWMYEGPGSAVTSSEEYKLGKAFVPSTAATELQRLEDKSVAGSTWLDVGNKANEEFVRVNEDPLYKMRQSETRDRDNKVLKNPLAMKRIKLALADELREYDQRKQAKKEAKKAKKKKKKKKKKRNDSDDDDESPEQRPVREEGFGLTKGVRNDGGGSLGPPKALLEAREQTLTDQREAQQRRRQKVTLSAEDLEARRKEMQVDGDVHEKNRADRMRHHRKTTVQECLDEDETIKKRRRDDRVDSDDDDVGPKFLRQARSQAFGDQSTIDLAEAVNRSRNRHQKKTSAVDFFDD